MQTVGMYLADVQAAAAMIPEDQPIMMLNLLRYRAVVVAVVPMLRLDSSNTPS